LYDTKNSNLTVYTHSISILIYKITILNELPDKTKEFLTLLTMVYSLPDDETDIEISGLNGHWGTETAMSNRVPGNVFFYIITEIYLIS
jgi:hypothetical protein